ncbi:MAG: hypothetical protein GXY55_05635 [Phycisphaerae bacterium]|nr:hypothetical protein [Phycisphaerae bacterium]
MLRILVKPVVCAVLVTVAVALEADAKLIYVNQTASGANDGTSWQNAYTDLRAALIAAENDDVLWVAHGVYKPTTGTDRVASFLIEHKRVSMYGSFVGTETNLAQRNIAAYPTVLSGDLAGNDTTDANGVVLDWEQIVGQDNSYNVVTVWGGDAGAVIDGFTITAGLEDSTDGRCLPAQCGSGILTAGAHTVLKNVVMRGNRGVVNPGGAIYYWEGSGSVTDCSFIGNAGCQGGAVHLRSTSVPFTRVLFQNNDACDPTGQSGTAAVSGGGLFGNATLTDVQFVNNTARHDGGGLSTDGSTLDNVRFEGNSSGEYGGGMWDAGFSTLRNVQFINNSTGQRGGGYSGASGGAPGNYWQVLFQGNTSGDMGGGFYYEYGGSGSAGTLLNCSFIGNQANEGGAIWQFSGELYLDNAIIRDNQATGWCSVLRQQYPGRATMTNCTITNNTTPNNVDFSLYSLTIRNSIIWNNNSEGFGGGSYNVSYSILSNTCPGGCDHVINSDPLFVSAATGDLHLQATSPAIDAGNNLVASPVLSDYDMDGKPRKREVASIPDTGNGTAPIVDLGAYEATYGTYWVDATSNSETLGTVSGGGVFNQSSSVTVTATAIGSAQFASWTENGAVVSTSASYTFTLTGDRHLVARFITPFTATVTPAGGPLGGGTTVELTNCSPSMGGGTDISAVWVGTAAAQIVSQGAGTVTIVTPAGTTAGPTDIAVQSATAGLRTLLNGFSYEPSGIIETLEPGETLDMGDPANSNRFGSASIASSYAGYTGLGYMTGMSSPGHGVTVPVPIDFVSVTFRIATPTDWRSAYWVSVQTQSTPLVTNSGGQTLMKGTGSYTTWRDWTLGGVSGTAGKYLHIAYWGYEPMNLDSIRFNLSTPRGPSHGIWYGGYQVTIRGTSMCDSLSDLRGVTLCGVPVAQIVSATPTQIVVIAGKATAGGTGDVRVDSIMHGAAVRANGFTYGPVGDINDDGSVDVLDCDAFELCRSGASIARTADCAIVDFDNDNDVDQTDFGLFQVLYTEPAAQ